jgi:hypothetical protein
MMAEGKTEQKTAKRLLEAMRADETTDVEAMRADDEDEED